MHSRSVEYRISSSVDSCAQMQERQITGLFLLSLLILMDQHPLQTCLHRLEKELAKWQKELDMVGKKLSNERFVANAKPEVVQKERDKQADYQAKYDATVARIDEMKKLVK